MGVTLGLVGNHLHLLFNSAEVRSYFARNDWWFGDLLRRNNCMLRRVST